MRVMGRGCSANGMTNDKSVNGTIPREAEILGLQLTRALCSQTSTHLKLVALEAAAFNGGFSGSEEGRMYDNEAVAQCLYGGVDRLRANIATSQAAYAEASKRAAREPVERLPGCHSLRPSSRRGGSRSAANCQSTSGQSSLSARW
jgi:hypothetical protein